MVNLSPSIGSWRARTRHHQNPATRWPAAKLEGLDIRMQSSRHLLSGASVQIAKLKFKYADPIREWEFDATRLTVSAQKFGRLMF